MDKAELMGIVSIALLGSFSHCLGMCGGIVLTYSNSKVSSTSNNYYKFLAHSLYNLGRVSTYTILGVIFGSLGSVFTITKESKSALFLLSGIIMISFGLYFAGLLKKLNIFQINISNLSLYKNTFKKLMTSKGLFSFFALGLINGLLPCGFVYFFAASAASSASPITGGLIMLIFGLSTIPGLASLGFFVGIIQATKLRNHLQKLSGVAIVGYGAYFLYKSYILIQASPAAHMKCH